MAGWKKLLWIAVTLLGLGSVCVLAVSRGEPVNALWIVIAGLCATAISYRFYSKWLATKVLVLNDERATPAVVRNDGKDFVPTNRWMAFGHHFAGLADEYYTSSVAYLPRADRVEPWEPNVTALLDPSQLKWKDQVGPKTPLPTPWLKEEYEQEFHRIPATPHENSCRSAA